MDRLCHRPGSRYGRILLLVATLALVLAHPLPARAATIPFAILIPDGLTFQQFSDGNGLFVFTIEGDGAPFFWVVNGQKGADPVGHATVRVWSRSVPDPVFAPFGPVAALVTLEFSGGPPVLAANLSLIQTPTGLLTTVGLAMGTSAVTSAAGAWVFANGAGVAGGDADDLVIAGLLQVNNAPTALGDQSFELIPHFPASQYYFTSDGTPNGNHFVGEGVWMGSFYGQASGLGPTRGYTSIISGPSFDREAHLLAIHEGGDTYIVAACAWTPAGVCTISGTGLLAGLAGQWEEDPPQPPAIYWLLKTFPFLVLP